MRQAATRLLTLVLCLSLIANTSAAQLTFPPLGAITHLPAAHQRMNQDALSLSPGGFLSPLITTIKKAWTASGSPFSVEGRLAWSAPGVPFIPSPAAMELKNESGGGADDPGLRQESLADYLTRWDNSSADIAKAIHLIAQHTPGSPLILEWGAGRAWAAYDLALQNPGVRVIATDIYDSPFYPETNNAWNKKELRAHRSPLPNLVVLRAPPEITDYLPDHSIDIALMINVEPELEATVGSLFSNPHLSTKLNPKAKIVILPFDGNQRGPEISIKGFPAHMRFEKHPTLLMGVDLNTHSDYHIHPPRFRERSAFAWQAKAPAVSPNDDQASGPRASEFNLFLFALLLTSLFILVTPAYLMSGMPGSRERIAVGLLGLAAALAVDLWIRSPKDAPIAVTGRGKTTWLKGYLTLDLLSQSFVDLQEKVNRFATRQRILSGLNRPVPKTTTSLKDVGFGLLQGLEEMVAQTIALTFFIPMALKDIVRFIGIQKGWTWTWQKTTLELVNGLSQLLFGWFAVSFLTFIGPAWVDALQNNPIAEFSKLQLLISLTFLGLYIGFQKLNLSLSAGWVDRERRDRRVDNVIAGLKAAQNNPSAVYFQAPKNLLFLHELIDIWVALQSSIRESQAYNLAQHLQSLENWLRYPPAARWLGPRTLTGLLDPRVARKLERWSKVDKGFAEYYGRRIHAIFPELRMEDGRGPISTDRSGKSKDRRQERKLDPSRSGQSLLRAA